MSASEETLLIERATRVFPGGVLANLTLPEPYLFVPDRGDGSHLYDEAGERWIDYRCGSGCLILGHKHPAVKEAVEKQIEKGFHFTQIINRPAVELAEAVVDALPSAEQVRFACTGGEATFFALRLARAHTGRDKVLKFEGAYHGHGDHMVDMLPPGYEKSRIGHPGAAGIPRSAKHDYVVVPFNDLEATRAAAEKHKGDLAAIIVEPILGFIPPKEGFLEGLRDVCTKLGACLVFDEVVTGFWTAYGGAQEYFGVTPDITALGKAFGGGFPISAVCARREIMARFDHVNEPVEGLAYHGGSLYGHPTCAAASGATLGELRKPAVYERLYELGDTMRDALRGVVKKHPEVPATVMGTGPTWHICFTRNAVTDYRSNMTEDSARRKIFERELWAQRIHVMGRGYISHAHTEEDLEQTVKACDVALGSTQ